MLGFSVENQRLTRRTGGAEGNRTPDLCSAIAALSHLSYSPAPPRHCRKAVALASLPHRCNGPCALFAAYVPACEQPRKLPGRGVRRFSMKAAEHCSEALYRDASATTSSSRCASVPWPEVQTPSPRSSSEASTPVGPSGLQPGVPSRRPGSPGSRSPRSPRHGR